MISPSKAKANSSRAAASATNPKRGCRTKITAMNSGVQGASKKARMPLPVMN